jgi:hypothetical protein
MVCERMRPILDELARGGPVEMADRQRALAHAERCAECAEYQGMSETLTRALGSWAAEERELEAPARVEVALRAAFREGPGGRQRRVPPTAPVLIGLGAAAAVVIAALFGSPRLGAPPSPGTLRPAESAQMGAPPAEPAVGFVPFLFPEPLDEEEGGQVVRVSLPMTALASMGWPVSDETSLNTVEADVLVGEDGLARAVRFVD